jgi:hypothetical protein
MDSIGPNCPMRYFSCPILQRAHLPTHVRLRVCYRGVRSYEIMSLGHLVLPTPRPKHSGPALLWPQSMCLLLTETLQVYLRLLPPGIVRWFVFGFINSGTLYLMNFLRLRDGFFSTSPWRTPSQTTYPFPFLKRGCIRSSMSPFS